MRTISFHFRFYFFLVPLVVITIPQSVLAGSSYFEMRVEKNYSLKPFPKWTGMMNRFAVQQRKTDGECGKIAFYPCVIPQWRELVTGLVTKSLSAKLDSINDWGNKHPYITDQLNWGLQDYWTTPYEFMDVNGDCEDYAIAKYYSLRAAGVPKEHLRIIIVQDLNLGGIIHAILGVYEYDKLWILDNQIKQVREAESIYHYRPIYGVNEDHWWRYYPKNQL